MLNDAKIRAAKAREKAYKLTDSHRLYLLIKPGGLKLWKWSPEVAPRQFCRRFRNTFMWAHTGRAAQ